jgi:hypothetical protein
VQNQKQKEEDDEYEIGMTIGLPCNLLQNDSSQNVMT